MPFGEVLFSIRRKKANHKLHNCVFFCSFDGFVLSLQAESIMKRHLIILVFIFLGISAGFAQRIGGGLLIGPAFSTMKLADNDSTRFRTDFCGGIRIALIPKNSIFGAEIDVIYSRQGMKTKSGTDEDKNRFHYIEKSSYINVPILLNVYMRKWNDEDESEAKMARLRVGPYIGFCFGGNDVVSTRTNRDTKQAITPWKTGTYNSFDYGFTTAISYWFIEIRYSLGLNNVFKGDGVSTNHVISVTWSDVW